MSDNSEFIPPKRSKPIGSGRKRIQSNNILIDNIDSNNPLQNSDGSYKDIFEVFNIINDNNKEIPEKYRYLTPKVFGAITDESIVTIYTRVSEGRIDYTVFNDNIKTIDINSKKARDYIQHRKEYLESVKKREQERKNNPQGVKIKNITSLFGEDFGELDNALAVRALKAKVEKDEIDIRLKKIKAQKDLNQLIDKKLVQDIFGRMGKCIREMIFPLPDRLSDEIAAMFESTDTEKVSSVRKLISEDISRFLTDFLSIMETDLKNDSSEITEEELEDE